MEYTRRKFIQLGISSLFLPTIISSIPLSLAKGPNKIGQLLVSVTSDPKKYGNEERLIIFDLNNLSYSFIPLKFSAHSFTQHPKNKELIIAMGKWNKYLCAIDKQDKKVIGQVVLKSDKEEFGGHGSFSIDGKYFFASVIEHENGVLPRKRPGNGLIRVYESEGLKLVNEFKSHGLEPHESIFLNDEKTLLVLNAGGRQDLFKENGGEEYFEANVAFLNSENGNLIKEIKLGKRQSYLQHIAGKSGEDVVAVGYEVGLNEKKSPLVAKISNDGKITPVINSYIPNKGGFLISSRFERNSKYFLSTFPQEDVIFLGDVEKGKILKSLKLDGYPSGAAVSLDNKFFVVNTLNGIYLIDKEKFIIDKKLFFKDDFFLGSHSLVV